MEIEPRGITHRIVLTWEKASKECGKTSALNSPEKKGMFDHAPRGTRHVGAIIWTRNTDRY